MILMQGAETNIWWWCETVLTVLAILCVWYFVISGRDRQALKQRRGEQHVERFGTIEQNEAPLTKFLIWTYVGTGLFVVGYLVWTGVNGLW